MNHSESKICKAHVWIDFGCVVLIMEKWETNSIIMCSKRLTTIAKEVKIQTTLQTLYKIRHAIDMCFLATKSHHKRRAKTKYYNNVVESAFQSLLILLMDVHIFPFSSTWCNSRVKSCKDFMR